MSFRTESEVDRLLSAASDAEREARRLEADARAARAHAETMTRLWSEAFDRERKFASRSSLTKGREMEQRMAKLTQEVESLLIKSLRLSLR
jgi:hypothetical protein